jgi:hypothetical protein
MEKARRSGPDTARRARPVRIALALTLAGAAAPSLLVGAPSALAVTDPVIVAAGDIACDPANSGYNGGTGTPTDCRQRWTADLLSPTGPVGPVDAVLTLGDEQYGCGGLTAFHQVYDATWGVHRAKTRPVPGNHEYQTTGGTDCPTQHDAAGYYSYFGSAAGEPAKGYYSYDVGTWHVIAINSELCFDVSDHDNTPGTRCAPGSEVETWLRNDLAAHPGVCSMAYWHEPRFSSTPGRGNGIVDPLWQALAAARVDVLLTAHQHFYERLAPMNGAGQADPNGVRQFIVGTGGESLMPLSTRLPTSQASDDRTFGVLKMALHPTSYEWQFVPVAGSTFTDAGSTACHPLQADSAAPTTGIACRGAPCSAGWYGTRPVSVSLSATDTGGSGLARTAYTTDGSEPTTSATAVTYTGPFEVGSTSTVRYFSTDKAGNAEATRSQLIRVDTVAPTTTVGCHGSSCQTRYSGVVTVSLTAGDTGGSGVAQTRYTLDGTDPAASATALTYTAPFPVATSATVSYFSADGAGNVEATRTQPIQIGPPPDDTSPPTTSIACNGGACTDGWYGAQPVRVNLWASDTGGSGVAQTRYTVDGTDPATSATAVTYTGAFPVAETTTVRYGSADNAGNAETTQVQPIRIDDAAPETSATCDDQPCSGRWYRAAVRVGLSAADSGGSGAATTFYTTDGSDPATSATAQLYTGAFTVAATATVKATSTDAVGNVEPSRSWPVRIDAIPPSTPIWCDNDPCGSGVYPGPVTVTLPATDTGGSGLARTVYTTDGTDPVTAATYAGPFSASRTTTVSAFSIDVAGNVEPTGTQLIQVGSSGGTTGSATLYPTDDSYTSKGNPTGTHGAEGSVNVNSGTGERRTHLRFAVSGIPADAIGVTATLRMYAQSDAPSTVTFAVRQAATSWNEDTLTWNNQPAPGSTVTTRAGLSAGVYNAFDVSSLVNRSGTYAMVLTDDDSTQRYFSSKESSPWRPPQLVISWTLP